MSARVVLLALLGAQLLFGAAQPRSTMHPHLPRAPEAQALRAFGLGDPIALGQMLLLYLQGMEHQAGAGIPLNHLDYREVRDWLQRLIELDPQSTSPLLLATHVYAQVPDADKQRQMLDFAYRAYLDDPARRWRWLAHACLMARHRLHDLPLALRYARALRAGAAAASLPGWALQMESMLQEQLGERDSARVLLGALIATGRIGDPQEVRFLIGELDRLSRSAEDSTSVAKNR